MGCEVMERCGAAQCNSARRRHGVDGLYGKGEV